MHIAWFCSNAMASRPKQHTPFWFHISGIQSLQHAKEEVCNAIDAIRTVIYSNI